MAVRKLSVRSVVSTVSLFLRLIELNKILVEGIKKKTKKMEVQKTRPLTVLHICLRTFINEKCTFFSRFVKVEVINHIQKPI